MPWQELYLVGWQGHHIHPVNWSGKDAASNMQFMKAGEHTLFTTWFNRMAAEIRGYIDGKHV